MPTLEKDSVNLLATCHPEIQTLVYEVVKSVACRATAGFRNEAEQTKAVAEGNSKDPWPTSPHNKQPSLAVDLYPLPIDFKDTERFYFFAGYVLGIAQKLKDQGRMSHSVRWGGNWKGAPGELNPRGVLNDLVHFELIMP